MAQWRRRSSTPSRLRYPRLNQNNLQELHQQTALASPAEPSFDGVIRGIFNRGDFFCNSCMDLLASHLDLDRLMGYAPEQDLQPPTRQKLETLETVPLPAKAKQANRDSHRHQVPAVAEYSFFENDKFAKLCSILESNFGRLMQPPTRTQHSVSEQILGDKIRELTEDLRVSQTDLEEYKVVITQLCVDNKRLKTELVSLQERLALEDQHLREIATLKVC